MPGMDTDTKRGSGGGSAFEDGLVANDGRSGRFIGAHGLTKRERAFVVAYLQNGCNSTLAATTAGYAFPAVTGRKLLRKPKVAALVREEREVTLSGKLGSMAFKTLENLLTDETTPAATKFAVAKFVIEANGYGLSAQVAKAKLVTDTTDKPLSEYSAAELRELVAAQQAAVDAMRSVSAPIIEAEVVQVSAGE